MSLTKLYTAFLTLNDPIRSNILFRLITMNLFLLHLVLVTTSLQSRWDQLLLSVSL